MDSTKALPVFPVLEILALVFLLCAGSSTVSASDGATVYKQYCQACHQAGGAGVPGVFPPLSNNSNISDNPGYIAEAIIKGVSGPLEVNGKRYNAAMPAMGHVNNKQIAALVGYLLSDLNGAEGALSEADIEKLR